MKTLCKTLLVGALLATFSAFAAAPASAQNHPWNAGGTPRPQAGRPSAQTPPQRPHYGNVGWEHQRERLERERRERIERERRERERRHRHHSWEWWR